MRPTRKPRYENDDFSPYAGPEYREKEVMKHKYDHSYFSGVSYADGNTISGKWAENRGRRGDQVRLDNPFENGDLSNWNHRFGWDEYYGPHKGKGPKGYIRPDHRIHDDVCEHLTRDTFVDASGIEVNVKEGVVTLSGKVEDREMKRFAGALIDRVPGVKDIHNLLELIRR